MGECLDIISGSGGFYPATSVTRPPPTTRTGSYARSSVHVRFWMEDIHLYLSVDPKIRHGIHNAEKSWYCLGLLPDFSFVNLKGNPVMLEVSLNLLAIDVIDIQVRHCQNTAPTFIAFGQLGVFDIEDTVQESEIVRNFFVTVNMESILRLRDCSFQVRHFRMRSLCLEQNEVVSSVDVGANSYDGYAARYMHIPSLRAYFTTLDVLHSPSIFILAKRKRTTGATRELNEASRLFSMCALGRFQVIGYAFDRETSVGHCTYRLCLCLDFLAQSVLKYVIRK